MREVRYRRLPARLMMVFTLACWLFMRSGYGLVLSKLADRHAATRRLHALAKATAMRMPPIHPHMLRHIFVTTMLDAGVDW